MEPTLSFVILIVVVAFAFDAINGFHDSANSIATVVSTRVHKPGTAVVWAALFNFIAFAILGTSVAKTIGGDLVHIELIQTCASICSLPHCLGRSSGTSSPGI